MSEETVLDAQSQSGDVSDATGATDTQTTQEGATETPAGTETQTEGEAAAPVVPEEYADFTMPEGVEMNAELMNSFKPLAKELGLTQEAAQKLVDLQSGWVKAEAKARDDAFEATLKEWREANKKDPEFGGAKWEQTKEAAGKFVQRLGTDTLRELLNQTGLGDHPEVIRIFSRAAALISEDTHVGAHGSEHREKTIAQKMYPSMYQDT